MKVITAPDYSFKNEVGTLAFLAGGITNCPEWQDEVIEILKDSDAGVLLNPRRKNFPIHDPNAAREQITWEFDALGDAQIFSMWFSAGESDQPICMYEYGRNVAIHQQQGDLKCVVVGVEPGYRREADVRIQSELVSPVLAARITDNLEDHAENIRLAMEAFRDNTLESLW